MIDFDPDNYRLKEAKELTAARSTRRSKKAASWSPSSPVKFSALKRDFHR